jgi:DNA-(apurinic or apyrimidinic site) lyase
MQPLSTKWEFGHFAAAFTVLGLNDYQTKGKAEVGYWPKVVPLLSCKADPKKPQQLIAVLEPFYSRERFAKNKVKRLQRFLTSDLCQEVWSSDPPRIAADFGRIWRALGSTMGQEPTTKTIAFAMKCLALALLMIDESGFDFGAIPVPVDSRIRSVSIRLGLTKTDDVRERERWHKVLKLIRESRPRVTMVHLDSLLWQIGTLSRQKMQTHLIALGAKSLAPRIAALFSAVVERPNAAATSVHGSTCRRSRSPLHKEIPR